MEALCGTLEKLAGEPQQRVVILQGAGPSFCAGLDLNEASDTRRTEESADYVARTFATLMASPLVTVAAAQGAAYAGGAGLMACCDFVVAADDLRIGFPEVRRGLVPALAAVVLRQRLRNCDLHELLLLAEPIDAQRAWSMGLLHRLVPRERLLAEAREIAAGILKGAPGAVRLTKRLLRDLAASDPAQHLEQALAIHRQARLSDEAQEGLAAFRQHREPRWPANLE